MALRAEIAVIDDDENVVGIVKVDMVEPDLFRNIKGGFAENLVTDPATGKVHRIKFESEVAGDAAPLPVCTCGEPEAGDTVRIIASDNPFGHALKIGSVGKVRQIESDGAVLVDGIMEDGRKMDQHVAPEDIVVVEGSTFPREGDFVRIIGNDNPVHHNLKVGELAEVLEVDSYGGIRAEGVGLSGKTIGQYVSRDDYILE